MRPMIDIDTVCLKYGPREVIRKVSVQISQGEFFMIIGPNGAGKTSLLKAISGLHAITSGRLHVQKKSVTDYSRKELSRTLAMVPQSINVDFPFTVAETVLMGRYPHLGFVALESLRDIEFAEQAMEFTEVLHLSDRRLGQLSGGERQRVIIARALCQNPKILLLDEPTASLDPAHQLKIMDLMERLRRQEQTTIVMVSHDLNLASIYADRLLLLKNGQVAKTGVPQEVLTRPLLETCYACNLAVDEQPFSGTPRVSLLPEKVLSCNN